MFDTGSQAIDPVYYPNESINSSIVTIFEILTLGVQYGEIRDEPIFRASQWLDKLNTFDNETSPGLLGCIDDISICDVDLKKCWNYLDYLESGAIDPKYGGQVMDRLPRIFDDTGPKPDLARALLYSSMQNSFIGLPMDYHLEGVSHCRDGNLCYDLPRNQWRVEARQMFETSLATMQFNVLDMVRGNIITADPTTHWNVPLNYQGMCRMGKFKSTGWQNVSFWGLFGVLFLAAAISLASVKSEKGELWLVLGAVLLYHAFLWGKDRLKTIWGASIPREIVTNEAPYDRGQELD